MVDVELFDIVKEETSNGHMILLADKGGRMFPIFVGPPEAASIAAGVRKTPFPRPMTHDLLCSLLEAAGVKVQSVDISSLQQATYYSTIRIKSAERERGVDARPSDAVALAVRLHAPIRVAEEVMDTAAIQAPELERSAQGMSALLRYMNDKLKQAAADKGWTVPDLLRDPKEAKVRSLLSDP
jgi:bifunctional DNase/RNase